MTMDKNQSISHASSTNSVMSQLKGHLNVRIRREFAFLHKTLAIDILDINMEIDVVVEFGCLCQTFLNNVIALELALIFAEKARRCSLHSREWTISAWSVSRHWNEECHGYFPIHRTCRENRGERRPKQLHLPQFQCIFEQDVFDQMTRDGSVRLERARPSSVRQSGCLTQLCSTFKPI